MYISMQVRLVVSGLNVSKLLNKINFTERC